MADETIAPVFIRRGVARLDFDNPAELAERFAEWRHESPLIMDCFDVVESAGGSEVDALRLCTLTFMELASQASMAEYSAQLAANRAECRLAELQNGEG
jgi:hypothetical protein